MITIPLWLLIVLSAFAFVGLLCIGFITVELISEAIYQRYEINKRKKV